MKVIKAIQTKGYDYGIYSEHNVGTGCSEKTRMLLGNEAEMAVFLTCTWEIPGSMLAASPCTLPQYSRGKYRDSIRIASLNTILNLLFACRSAIRRYTV